MQQLRKVLRKRIRSQVASMHWPHRCKGNGDDNCWYHIEPRLFSIMKTNELHFSGIIYIIENGSESLQGSIILLTK